MWGPFIRVSKYFLKNYFSSPAMFPFVNKYCNVKINFMILCNITMISSDLRIFPEDTVWSAAKSDKTSDKIGNHLIIFHVIDQRDIHRISYKHKAILPPTDTTGRFIYNLLVLFSEIVTHHNTYILLIIIIIGNM